MGIFFIKQLARIPRSSCFHGSMQLEAYNFFESPVNVMAFGLRGGRGVKALASAHLMLHDDVTLG